MSRGAPTIRKAFSLVEMMAAMTVLSILAVGIGATMAIASRAVDDGTAPGSQIPEARNIGDVIIADLNDALTITERTDKSITFTVPDRDDDGDVETIRYAWDGNPGGNLTRKYNKSLAVVIAEDVYQFDLSYLTRTIKPPARACCYIDGTCDDVSPDDCTSNGGLAKTRNSACESTDCIGACCMENGSCVDTNELKCTQNPNNRYRGDGSRCADATCPNALEVLMVVSEGSSPVADDVARQALMESWGHSVSYIDDRANQTTIDSAVASADVVYISETVNPADVGSKFVNVAIGVVNEEMMLTDEFGFTSASSSNSTGTTVTIIDNSHYITSTLRQLPTAATNSDQPLTYNSGAMAAGVQVIANVADEAALFAVDTGDALVGDSPAPGRRVQLPWGGTGFDVTELTDASQNIMKRAIEWAAGVDEGTPYCGDGNCDDGEDPCTCSDDCGTRVANEQVSFNCDDGIDNDCDGETDCADSDCDADPVCAAVCGNSTCDPGENSCNCEADCGAPAASETGDTDCADGLDNDCDGDTDCDDSECSAATPCNPYCGDSKCNTGENPCNCSADCGTAPLTEENCEDNEDNDCDGSTDCDDSDCADDAACADSCDCDGIFADNFESGSFSGSSGTLDWTSTPWIEIGESDGVKSGRVRVAANLLSDRLVIAAGDHGVMRAVELCASGSASISLNYRRESFELSDYIALEISSTGSGGPWTEITRFSYLLPGTDVVYLPYSTDISAFASDSTWIRIIAPSSMDTNDRAWFDNVRISCSP